jgi:hypothetical protein
VSQALAHANFGEPVLPRRLSIGKPADYRVGVAVGGASPEPSALAGLPGRKRLQPLLPETRWQPSHRDQHWRVFSSVCPGAAQGRPMPRLAPVSREKQRGRSSLTKGTQLLLP